MLEEAANNWLGYSPELIGKRVPCLRMRNLSQVVDGAIEMSAGHPPLLQTPELFASQEVRNVLMSRVQRFPRWTCEVFEVLKEKDWVFRQHALDSVEVSASHRIVKHPDSGHLDLILV